MKVRDTGPFGAKMMLVGEAPGKEEAEQGVPFVGRAGKTLKHMLQHSGIKYQDCYVTNITNERPPNNKFEHFYEDKSRKNPTPYLEECWSKLREKVTKLKPNVVVALGAEPLRALTNKTNIKNNRGCPIQALGTTILPTYHPSAVLRQYQPQRKASGETKKVPLMPIVEMDLVKAKIYSILKYTEPPTNIILKPSLTDVLHFLNNVTERIAFDLETVGHHIRCIGIATGSIKCPRAIVIPFISFQNTGGFEINKGVLKIGVNTNAPGSSYWTAENELVILDSLNKIFSNPEIEVVGQNSMSFDEPLLIEHFKMPIANHYMDTMHAHHDLYSELPMNLNFLCSMYTNYKNYWSDKVTENDMSEWQYCAMDSITTYISSYKIEENLKSANMVDYYFNHRRPLALALAVAQMEGLDIDEDRRNELIREQKAILKDLESRINEIAKCEVNINSPKQVAELLYERMNFPKILNKSKNVTTDEKALRSLERKFPNQPILESIIMYRKTKKLISTYLLAKCDPDGKMRTSWNPSGTEGARISSSKTIRGTGITMQNIPKGVGRGTTNIRDMFIAGRTKCTCGDSCIG
jgi:uracil-DNA glycosylase family 4